MPRQKKPQASLRKSQSVSLENGLHDLSAAIALDTPGRSQSDVNNTALEAHLETLVGPIVIAFVREYGIDAKVPFSQQKDKIKEMAKDHWKKTNGYRD